MIDRVVPPLRRVADGGRQGWGTHIYLFINFPQGSSLPQHPMNADTNPC